MVGRDTTGDGFDRAAEDAQSVLHGRRRRVARGAFLVTAGILAGGALVWVRAGFVSPPSAFVQGPLPMVLTMAAALTFAICGLVISLHRPEVRMGQMETALAMLLAIQATVSAYLALGTTPQGADLAYQPAVAMVTATLVSPLATAIAVLFGFLFPTDRYLTPRWRGLAWLTLVAALLAGTGVLLRAGPIPYFPTFDNPFASGSVSLLAQAATLAGYALLATMALASGMCLVTRYRHADAIERQQLRAFAVVGTLLGASFAVQVSLVILQVGGEAIALLSSLVFDVVLLLSPVTVLFCISRYRLYAIDHLVGRTFVYGLLTAFLAGVLAASLKVSEALVLWMTGGRSDVGLVLTTLILATTFAPIKARLEKVVAHWTRPHGEEDVPAAEAVSALTEAQRVEIRELVAIELERHDARASLAD